MFPVRITLRWSRVVGLPCRQPGEGTAPSSVTTAVIRVTAQCKGRNQQTTRLTPLGRWRRKAGGDGKPMWCLFHKSTTHSDEVCRRQQQQMKNNGSANCANQGWDYPAVLTASDPLPGINIKEQGISFAAVEVPTREEP